VGSFGRCGSPPMVPEIGFCPKPREEGVEGSLALSLAKGRDSAHGEIAPPFNDLNPIEGMGPEGGWNSKTKIGAEKSSPVARPQARSSRPRPSEDRVRRPDRLTANCVSAEGLGSELRA